MRRAETHVLRNAKRMRIVGYVRLCSLNWKKIVAGAARGHPGAVRNRPIADCRLEIANWGKHGAASGERGKRPGFKFLTVRDLISHCTGSGYENAKVRIRALCGSRSNREAVFESSFANWSEHRESRPSLVTIGAFSPANQIRSVPTKSDQIR